MSRYYQDSLTVKGKQIRDMGIKREENWPQAVSNILSAIHKSLERSRAE